MGGVVQAIGNAVSSIGNAVGKVVQSAGNIVSGVVKGIASNPLKAIATVAAVATGNAWAIPIINGVDALAHGATIGQALTTAAASYVGNFVAGALPIGDLGMGATLTAAAQGVVRGAVSSAIEGKSIADGAVGGGLTGLVGGAIGQSDIGKSLAETGLGAAGAGIVTNAISGGLNAAVKGKDVEKGVESGTASGLFNWAANGINGVVDNVSNYLDKYKDADPQTTSQLQEVNNQIAAQNEQLAAAQSQYAQVVPQAQDAYKQYQDLSSQYQANMAPSTDAFKMAQTNLQTQVDDYNNVKSQYDAAVASGDNDTATKLSNDLNAKADAINAYYAGDYASAKNAYDSAAAQNQDLYTQANDLATKVNDYNTQLNDLNNQGKELSSSIQDNAKNLQDQTVALTNKLDQQTLKDIGNQASSAYGDLGGMQKFDDGSSIQTFDDGSMIITNSEGGTQTIDSDGNTFDSAGNAVDPQKAGSSGAKNYASALRQMAQSGAVRGTRAGMRSNAAAGKPAANANNASASSDPLQQALGIAGGAGAAAASANGAPTENQTTADDLQTHSKGISAQNITSNYQNTGHTPLSYIAGVTNVLNPTTPLQQSNPYMNVAGQESAAGTGINVQNPGQSSGSVTGDLYGSRALDQALNPFGDNTNNLNTMGQPLSGPAALGLGFAHGGSTSQMPEDFSPEFYSIGGASHVGGADGGTADTIPSMLSSGEFVIPANVVSALGNGNNEHGATILDRFVEQIRKHKRENPPSELEPDALSPLQYLKKAGA